MMDERAAIERAIERFQPESGIVDRVYDRRRRKQRIRRIGTAGLALILTAALIAGVVTVSRSRSVPAGPRPPTFRPMPLLNNGAIDGFGITTDGVRVLDRDGLGAFVVKCSGSCTWIPSASWSPDGSHIAFSASCGGGCGSAGDPYHGVRIADPINGSDRLILPGDGIGPLAWSPDGSRMAYAIHGHTAADGWTWDNTWSLMVMNVDGSQEVAVTSGPIIDQVPDSISWSPDGTRIAYAAGGRIFVVGLDGAGPTPIAEGSHAAWSRDGDTIAYLVDCDVRATTPDGLHDRSIVDLATVGSDAATCDAAVDLAWSPDGTELAAMVDRNTLDPIVHADRAVFVIEADGGSTRLRVPWSRGLYDGLAWRPIP
jgi:Tol biopolymer transport system component